MKGLSPLIATVLLIGFTIAVGSILGVFVNTYMKNQTNDIVEPCTGVLYDLKAEINKSNSSVRLISQYMMGRSNKEVYNVTVTVICDNVKQVNITSVAVPGFIDKRVVTGLTGCDAKTNFEAYLYAVCNGNIQKLTECLAGDACVKNV